ncbi:tyrosine--tRNA ligase [Marinitenerispora sediminis]|uniref:Tyrosine--tRNA ligase n=1 Tax=Marinitenerispora sediminis TaxID=1931232 RepID=A0A368T3V1_9ACTN|nr:tyrosine--tRNA ligase [Marinitenerispora sediminis]RCV49936.1 tyrosine--tRNA ligase [Marinitenerispora sediminis]RCV52416.1 tyrosine--tRNA ligase [Marinitenerispora sediminis]RCV53040.1 tyrosine--tRNA ligase [Marinitenerispora sediminis]
MTDIIDELEWRGVLAQTTDLDELRKALADGPVTVYCGFDPTAGSLHVGHLTQILTLARFQRAGHRPIALVGGGTGLIGDPKPNAERSLNSVETVEQWVGVLGSQLSAFLRFAPDGATPEPTDAVLANNRDWLGPLSAIELLRDVGKHFSVNQMLARETVRSRLDGAGMSFTEFSYVLLQSYDYVELYRRYGCTLQTGGSDQWGNITSGLDLIRRLTGNEPHGPAHGLTTNLLTKADGAKFGKTETGTVWLDPELTSPYAFYQFWFNADDRDVVRYLRVFSFRDRAEIEELERQTAERPAARAAQRALAEELTTLVHGAEECRKVIEASRALFGQGDLAALDPATLGAALAEVPNTEAAGPAESLPPVVDLLAATGLVPSKSAARRAVQEGGAYLNNTKVTDVDARVSEVDLLHGRYLVLRRGKRNVGGVLLRP